jgi:hypothetical protein
MSDAQFNQHAFDSFSANEFVKQQSLDFFSFHSPSDVVAPHPDLFESDIDSNLAAFPDLQLNIVDSNEAYTYFRTANQFQGPLSTITVSSESYDSLSSHSESFYNEQIDTQFANLPLDPNQLFDLDLNMDFSRVHVGSEYSAVPSSMSLLDEASDPASFGALPPTPPRSPPAPMHNVKANFATRSAYSDYTPPHRSSTEYYARSSYTPSHSSISPMHTSPTMPTVASVAPQPFDEFKGDPRKKYRCDRCPRAFARAYNLKTHMGTHDPNRLKPHVCPQRSCGRSFSRKHDLGRHLISIHRDEAVGASLMAQAKNSIGVERGVRDWCSTCGASSLNGEAKCSCDK